MAIIDSMTPGERKHPDILKASRKKRIAAGAGTKVEEVNKLLKMHRTMADMMKAMGGGKARGPMAGLARMMGMGGGMPSPSPGNGNRACEEDAGRVPGGPPNMPAGREAPSSRASANSPVSAAAASCRRRADSPDFGKKRNENSPAHSGARAADTGDATPQRVVFMDPKGSRAPIRAPQG